MTSESLPAQPAGRRGYVRYSLPVVREILRRVADGESVRAICRDDPRMPTKGTVSRWVAARPKFRERLDKARRAAGRYGASAHRSGFCEVTAQEIFLRLAGGETMVSICRDPEMPADTTISRWRRAEPEFDEALRVAREIQGERFADLSVEVMDEATPETGFVTGVKLAHMRWLAAIHGPRAFSRTKPREAPVEPKQTHIYFRHFQIETREDGMVRFVSYIADPQSNGVVYDHIGDWGPPREKDAPKPLADGRAGGGGGVGGDDRSDEDAQWV